MVSDAGWLFADVNYLKLLGTSAEPGSRGNLKNCYIGPFCINRVMEAMSINETKT